MEILFATSELAPYARATALADFAAALPKNLRALGHNVTVIAPKFPGFEAGGLLLARRLTPLQVTLGGRAFEATLFDGRLSSQIDLILLDVPGLFDRADVYGPEGEPYADNALRFAVFSRAVAEVARQRSVAGRPIDVIHCNDWPTALVPAYVAAAAKEGPSIAGPATVLTVHDASAQGVFAKKEFASLGLDSELWSGKQVELGGKVNFLKLGVLKADRVVAVSEAMAVRLTTEGGGFRLDEAFRSRGDALRGITNGIDYSVWNPATDATLAARYDAEDITNKVRCRGALQRDLGFPIEHDVPLLVNLQIAPSDEAIDVIAPAVKKVLRATDAQVVVLVGDDPAVSKKMAAGAARIEGRIALLEVVTPSLIHKLAAGADFVMVGGAGDVGGVQMIAQRYGALPIAPAAGAILDTVIDADAKLTTGTGFVYDDPSATGLIAAIERAFAAKKSPRWGELVTRVMRLDRSWERPARRYEQLYRAVGRSASG